MKLLNALPHFLLATFCLACATGSFASPRKMTSPCEQILLYPEPSVVDVDFETKVQRSQTNKATLRALYQANMNALLRNKLVGENLKFPYIKLSILMRAQMKDLYNLFAVRLTSDPEERKRYEDATLAMLNIDNNRTPFIPAFNQPDSAELYERYGGPIQRYFSTLLVAYMAARVSVPLNAPVRILDLGAGTGDTIYAIRSLFPKSMITAVDNSREMLRMLGKRYPDVNAYNMDFGGTLPFADNSLDIIVSVSAAGQYANREQFEKVLNEAHRILKPGGRFLFEFGHPYSHSQTTFSLEDFVRWVAEFGFKTEPSIGLKLNIWKSSFYPILLTK